MRSSVQLKEVIMEDTGRHHLTGLGCGLHFDFFLSFLWPPLQHMEVPRLGVESELQLPVYTTATAMWDPSCACDLHHSLQQHQILNH